MVKTMSVLITVRKIILHVAMTTHSKESDSDDGVVGGG